MGTIPYHTIQYQSIPYHTLPFCTIPYHTHTHTLSHPFQNYLPTHPNQTKNIHAPLSSFHTLVHTLPQSHTYSHQHSSSHTSVSTRPVSVHSHTSSILPPQLYTHPPSPCRYSHQTLVPPHSQKLAPPFLSAWSHSKPTHVK